MNMIDFTYSDQISSEILMSFKCQLELLQEYCPSDSLVSASMYTMGAHFVVKISVVFKTGRFRSKSLGLSATLTQKQCLNKVFDQIIIWRSMRFQQNSILRPSTALSPAIKLRILIIDDDILAAKKIAHVFRQFGCETKTVFSGQEGIYEITQGLYDLVVLDWFLTEMNGGDVLTKSYLRLLDNDDLTRTKWSALSLPIIINSGQINESQDFFTHTHFRILDRWDKAFLPKQITSKAYEVIQDLDPVIRNARAA